MPPFCEHFLQISRNFRTINDQINISGDKPRKIDTLAKQFETMRNRPVSQHDYRTTLNNLVKSEHHADVITEQMNDENSLHNFRVSSRSEVRTKP